MSPDVLVCPGAEDRAGETAGGHEGGLEHSQTSLMVSAAGPLGGHGGRCPHPGETSESAGSGTQRCRALQPALLRIHFALEADHSRNSRIPEESQRFSDSPDRSFQSDLHRYLESHVSAQLPCGPCPHVLSLVWTWPPPAGLQVFTVCSLQSRTAFQSVLPITSLYRSDLPVSHCAWDAWPDQGWPGPVSSALAARFLPTWPLAGGPSVSLGRAGPVQAVDLSSHCLSGKRLRPVCSAFPLFPPFSGGSPCGSV